MDLIHRAVQQTNAARRESPAVEPVREADSRRPPAGAGQPAAAAVQRSSDRSGEAARTGAGGTVRPPVPAGGGDAAAQAPADPEDEPAGERGRGADQPDPGHQRRAGRGQELHFAQSGAQLRRGRAFRRAADRRRRDASDHPEDAGAAARARAGRSADASGNGPVGGPAARSGAAAEHPAAGRRGVVVDRSLRRSAHEGSGEKAWPRPAEPDRDPGCAAGARHDRADHAGPYRRSGADGGGGRQDGAFRDQVGAGPAGAVRQCQPDPEQGGGVEERRAVRVVLRPVPAGQTGGITGSPKEKA